jgi:hypothetical protein
MTQKLTPIAILLVGLAAPAGSALGQNTSSHTSTAVGTTPVRPPQLPEDYVITPFGYFHQSCVRTLAKGERLLRDGRLQHADGSIEPVAPVCEYPRYPPAGSLGGPAAAVAPQINGWLENANTTTGSPTESYAALLATWRVPPDPSEQDGQVLFFFPGLEDADDYQTSILQPVLEWASGQWSIASWNCCLSGITVASTPVTVHSGDMIYGSITSTCPPGTLSCPTWNVLSLDLFTGESTTLWDTPSDGQVFNWAFGGVLEAYYVASCADFPPEHRLVFNHVTLFDEYWRPIRDPQWAEGVAPAPQPACGYGVQVERHDVRLDY